MKKRIAGIVLVAMLMGSYAHAVFYSYWDAKPWDAPDTLNYTNLYFCHFGATNEALADILAHGHHIGINWNWVNPTPSEPTIQNGLRISRYRFEAYNQAGLIDMVYMIDSPYANRYGGTGPLLTRQDLDNLVDLYETNLPGYTLALGFDAHDLGRRVFQPGYGVPDNVDLAGVGFYPFDDPPIPDETEFDNNMSAVLTAFRGLKSAQTDMFFVGQGFYGDGFEEPPAASPLWYNDWIVSESDVVGMRWFKWYSWDTGTGSHAMPGLVANQQQAGWDLGIATSLPAIPVPGPYREGLIDRWTFNETDPCTSAAIDDGTIGLVGSFPEEYGEPNSVATPGDGSNKGFYFDGGDRFLFKGSHRFGQYSLEEATIEAWFKLTGELTGSQTIISKGSEFYLGVQNGKIVGGSSTGLSSDSMEADKWYHAAYVIEGTQAGDMEELYVNGLLVSSRASEWAGIYDADIDLMIGDKTGTDAFEGILDEVRIHDTALDATAIRDSYLAGPVGGEVDCGVGAHEGLAEWLIGDLSGPDGRPDCYVNMYDFAAIASDWGKCTDPNNPACTPNP